MDGRTDRCRDAWIDRWMDGWMDDQTDGWTDGRTSGQSDKLADRHMDKWVGGLTNRYMHACICVQITYFLMHNMASALPTVEGTRKHTRKFTKHTTYRIVISVCTQTEKRDVTREQLNYCCNVNVPDLFPGDSAGSKIVAAIQQLHGCRCPYTHIIL